MMNVLLADTLKAIEDVDQDDLGWSLFEGVMALFIGGSVAVIVWKIFIQQGGSGSLVDRSSSAVTNFFSLIGNSVTSAK